MLPREQDVLEKGTKAFISFVRAYKEHQCRFIFRRAAICSLPAVEIGGGGGGGGVVEVEVGGRCWVVVLFVVVVSTCAAIFASLRVLLDSGYGSAVQLHTTQSTSCDPGALPAIGCLTHR